MKNVASPRRQGKSSATTSYYVLFVSMRLKVSAADHSLPYQLLALPMRCDERLALDRVSGYSYEMFVSRPHSSYTSVRTSINLRFFF